MELRITTIKPTFLSYYSSRFPKESSYYSSRFPKESSYYSSRFPKESSAQQRRLVYITVHRLGPRYKRVHSCTNHQYFFLI